jgi:CheY-like chemotaxis protein
MTEEKKNKNIMLVDDDAFLLDMYATKFKKEGWETFVVTDPEKAFEKLKEGFDPDVLVIDIIMPKIDGIELYNKIFSEKLASKAVKVILTNQGESQDLEKVKHLDIDSYIIKALNTPSEVVSKVIGLYNKKHKNDE